LTEDTRQYVSMRMLQAEDALADARVLLDVRQSLTGTINRAYYAVFYAASAVLATRDLSSSRHTGVVSMFAREFVKKGSMPPEMGRILHRLFDMRQRSDYHSPAQPVRESAEECFQDACKFVEDIKQYLKAGNWLVDDE